jgi:hypothetical protein
MMNYDVRHGAARPSLVPPFSIHVFASLGAHEQRFMNKQFDQFVGCIKY